MNYGTGTVGANGEPQVMTAAALYQARFGSRTSDDNPPEALEMACSTEQMPLRKKNAKE